MHGVEHTYNEKRGYTVLTLGLGGSCDLYTLMVELETLPTVRGPVSW